jgi:hypothetical protein
MIPNSMTSMYVNGAGELKWDLIDASKRAHKLIRTFDGHWYGHENVDTGFLNNKYYQREILFRMENDPDMGEFKDCSWVRT